MAKFKDKRMNIIVNKIGLSEEVAISLINKSKKYCVWLANQVKLNENILNQEQDIISIIDWKKEFQNINLNVLSFEEALLQANEFQNSLFIESDTDEVANDNVVLDCGTYKWVQLTTEEQCIKEGQLMKHCIGGNGHSQRISSGKSLAFSLRDKYNKPHVTIELYSDSKVIFEFKGNSNQKPKTKYLKYFLELAKKYEFTQITDSTYKAFKEAPSIAKQLLKINDEFFNMNFTLELGILPFSDNSIVINHLKIHNDKTTIKLPDNLTFYTTVTLQCKEIKIGKNLTIGGDLQIYCQKLIIKDNIQVGGNVQIHSNLKAEYLENKIISFGENEFEILEELKEKEEVLN
jgi:hypothetical protein